MKKPTTEEFAAMQSAAVAEMLSAFDRGELDPVSDVGGRAFVAKRLFEAGYRHAIEVLKELQEQRTGYEYAIEDLERLVKETDDG